MHPVGLSLSDDECFVGRTPGLSCCRFGGNDLFEGPLQYIFKHQVGLKTSKVGPKPFSIDRHGQVVEDAEAPTASHEKDDAVSGSDFDAWELYLCQIAYIGRIDELSRL